MAFQTILKKFVLSLIGRWLKRGWKEGWVHFDQPVQSGSEQSQLASLLIDPGIINPSFSPETTTYTINVDKDTELINVTISLRYNDAKVVSANGFKNLKVGSNQAKIVVRGSDGSETMYSFTIQKDE